MQQHLNISISLDELCYEIGLSKYYFSRQFKVATGLSPMSYFNRLKIQKACILLISNTYRIQEISALLGSYILFLFSDSMHGN
jgi:AraC-like DNA-binding protein